MKASEKHDLTKRLVVRLERQFGPPVEPPERTVLETLLYAVCLENDTPETADRSFGGLKTEFHDLNEIRVSSISELSGVFARQDDRELRAHRVRSILQHVFEDQFGFDLEPVRKKTQEQAAKKLGKIRDQPSFVRLYVQQAALGAHVIPLDDRMTNAAVWLGLVDPGTPAEAAAEALKTVLRKTEAPAFGYYLKMLSAAPIARGTFDPTTFAVPEEGFDAATAEERLEGLLGGSGKGKARASKAGKASAPAGGRKTKSAAEASEDPAEPEKKPKGRSRAAS